MSDGNPSESALDLSACAREPIRTPGAIQPYGIVLVLAPDTLTVTERAVARPDLLESLGDPLGLPVTEVLGGTLAACAPVLATLTPGTTRFLGAHAVGTFGLHQVLGHRVADHLIVELEQSVPGEPGSLEDLYPQIRQFMAAIERLGSTHELCEAAADLICDLTGFDRTLVYQFDPEWNGAVVAEHRRTERLPSYLDLRFPESDIPAQARALYRQNRVRLIADSDYQAVPLIRTADHADAPPTDLSPVMLRSVSPVHLQYMRNMGTGASMSVSLLREGELWGLISCHNQEPMRVPYHVRTACEFIGQILSLQISVRERALAVEQRIARRAIQVRLLGQMAGDTDFMSALGRDAKSLLALTQSSGAAIVHRGACLLHGQCPSPTEVMALVQWLAVQTHEGDLFHTDSLPLRWKDAAAFSGVASGVLAISISQIHDSYVLWFRPEVVRTVRWGGDPRKEHHAGPLSPRTSFESWKETVQQQSLPWDEVDCDAALELRTAIVDIVLRKAEEMAALNEQLVRSNKELEAFSYSVSHDLRAPFRHIVGYSELLWASAAERLNDSEKRFVDTIVSSAQSAGRLVDDLLSFSQMGRSTMGHVRMEMTPLVEDARRTFDMEAHGRNIEWIIPPLPRVEADPGMLRLVWQNLFSNAIKFTRDTPHPRIEVGHERTGTEDVFFVKDNGCGFDMRYVDKLFGVFQRLHHADEFEGTGIGLANVHRIVSRHGGRTWAEGEVGVGATIYFTIPLLFGDPA
jgi:two-component system, chemotaxis family, sensor kinase Cph1